MRQCSNKFFTLKFLGLCFCFIAIILIGIVTKWHRLLASSFLNIHTFRFGHFNASKPFINILKLRMSKPDNVVLAAYVDYAFVDMAISFYEGSLRPWNITNFVFATSDELTCDHLRAALPLVANESFCFPYQKDVASQKASNFGTDDFLRKMNIRTDMILDCLEANITILHSDIDIFFQKNPFAYIHCVDGCDLAALMDCADPAYNAGFVYVRPTEYSKIVYRDMKRLASRNPKMNDQRQLMDAVKTAKSKFKDFKAIQLPTTEFVCGRRYFPEGKRTFAGDNPCPDCVVIHNNWIISKTLKVYRFKEHLMWSYDGDSYYSSESRRYFAYENQFLFQKGSNVVKEEREALISALAIGEILKRTVILPAFHCGGTKDSLCALNSVVNIGKFDSVFGGAYREHVFLRHPMVPRLYKTKSGVILIETLLPEPQFGEQAWNLTHDEGGALLTSFSPNDTVRGATSQEIEQWFGGMSNPVLHFRHLYRSFSRYVDQRSNDDFRKKVKRVF